MKKIAEAELSEIAIPTLDICPNCKQGELKCRIDIGIGVCRPKFKYCDTCGNVLEVRGGKSVSAGRV